MISGRVGFLDFGRNSLIEKVFLAAACVYPVCRRGPFSGDMPWLISLGKSGISEPLQWLDRWSGEHFWIDVMPWISFLDGHEGIEDTLVLAEGSGGVPRLVGPGAGGFSAGAGVVREFPHAA